MTEKGIQLIRRARSYQNRTAIIEDKREFSYGELLQAAARRAATLLAARKDLGQQPVGTLISPGFEYVAWQWGIWMAGGIAVPVCISHPLPEIRHVLIDTGAKLLIADASLKQKLGPLVKELGVELHLSGAHAKESQDLPLIDPRQPALILFTSGTTSRPKGVVHSHLGISSQIESLVEAWEWSESDRILNVLPLHHVHGIINVVACALWSGATCELLPRFDAEQVWDRFVSGSLTLFMAVPTIYRRLLDSWEKAGPTRRQSLSAACRKFRLMVSGSAALPVEVFERWEEVSGHRLLERYGMTEIGMALSNPLHGERRSGFVGQPLPGVRVRLVDEAGEPIHGEGQPGEIQVRGPTLFLKYWNQPRMTHKAFSQGWFRTGDMAQVEDGFYRILGRTSVDIIKSGGYKLSALEIEQVLLTHPAVVECSVVGVLDPEWGERVCAAVTLQAGHTVGLDQIRSWGGDRLARYKLPTRLLCVEDFPRTAMGKIVKTEVRKLFEKRPEATPPD